MAERAPFPITDPDLAARLTLPEFPRSARYDPHWALANMMGPNPLWLAESLLQVLEIPAGSRVLDLGCGKALTSIFLATELAVEVTAADLWIAAADNAARIEAAGLAAVVTPVGAEAHTLPFDPASFDFIVSFDAYQYFGTDDLYLGYLLRFLKPGGKLGVVMPALTHEIEDVPEHLRSWWEWDMWSWHSPGWWRFHWAKLGLADVLHADLIPGGWKHWLLWSQVADELRAGPFPDAAPEEIAALQADTGATLGFVRLVAAKNRELL